MKAKKIVQYTLYLIRQLRNKLLVFKLFILTFFFCFTAGPYVVVENYGNWKTLSGASKSAYITGLWDGYMVFFGEDLQEKYGANCSNGRITRVSDLVEIVDMLYQQEINRSFSPATLLREKIFQDLCGN